MKIGIPFWMYLVAAGMGIAFALLLYFKNKKQHYGKPLTVVLFVLRALIGGVVTMLLFNPYIRQKVSKVEQPIVVLAHDNSASIVLSKDSMYYKESYPTQIAAFEESLKKNFQVDEYLFGQEVRDESELDFTDQLTDISALLQSVERNYYKRNVGAVLLFSDGVYNRGFEPSLLTEKFAFPIHTVVLGDTMSYPDLFVKDVHCNRKVSLGSTFPIRVVVGAIDCSGKKAELTLSEDGRVMSHQYIEVSSNRFSKEVDFMLDADRKGVRQIEIEVKGLENESQRLNNVKRIFVDVQEQQYKRSLAYMEENEKKMKELEEQMEKAGQENTQLRKTIQKLKYANELASIQMQEHQQADKQVKSSSIYQRIQIRLNNKESIGMNDKIWKELEEVVEQAYNGFLKRVEDLCPLNWQERNLCLLIKAGFSPSNIAILTAHSKQSISSTRSRLYERTFLEKGTPSQWDEFILSI